MFPGLKSSRCWKMHNFGGPVETVPLCTELGSTEQSRHVQGGPLPWWWPGSAGHAAPWGSARLPSPRADAAYAQFSDEKKFKG